jgi:hypothetical protein
VYDDLIHVHLGHWPPQVPGRPVQVAATIRWFTAPQPGALAGIELPQLRDAGIRHVEVIKQTGDWVHPPFENADRLGYVMTSAASCQEAEQLADRYVALARVELQVPDAAVCVEASAAHA